MKLRLNKTLYSYEAISASVDAFSEIATIIVREEDKYWVCYFTHSKYDLEETRKEFENYVIGCVNAL